MSKKRLRIQTGIHKGRSLALQDNSPVRPTLNVIRSAIFDSLQSQINFETSCFVDLFAGSGAVGIEASSRGFEKVIFIETSPQVFKFLKQNLITMKLVNINLLFDNAYIWIKKFNRSKLVAQELVLFADPPYEKGYYERLFSFLFKYQSDIDYFLIIQIPVTIEFNAPSWLTQLQTKKYGKHFLHTLYHKA